MTGDHVGARVFLTEALALYDRIGITEPTATAVMAQIEFLAGNVERAVELMTTLVTTGFRSPFLVAEGFARLAAYLIASERWDAAQVHASEALDRAQHEQHYVALAWTIQHLVAIAALSPRRERITESELPERAALLLGYVDARTAALGASRHYIEQQEYDRVLTVLRDALGTDKLSKMMAVGALLTDDRALDSARLL